MSNNSSTKNFDSIKLPSEVRKIILEMAFNGNTVHIGCAFSVADLISVLFLNNYLNFPDNNPNSPGRDFFVLSKGHGVMAQYACMYIRGWLTSKDIEGYFNDGTMLKGLADSRVLGIETSTGSLGHGLSVALGMAFGSKLRNSDQKTICLVGDGEMNEGSIWEALLFAGHHKLDNLMLIVDFNKYQAMGKIDEILNLENLENKLESFGFEVRSIDGHNINLIKDAYDIFFKKKNVAKPLAIIANTIKGKGVSFMENDNSWHYKRLTEDLFNKALEELKP